MGLENHANCSTIRCGGSGLDTSIYIIEHILQAYLLVGLCIIYELWVEMAENGGQKTTIWWWLKSSKMLIFLWKMLKNGEKSYSIFLLNDDN